MTRVRVRGEIGTFLGGSSAGEELRPEINCALQPGRTPYHGSIRRKVTLQASANVGAFVAPGDWRRLDVCRGYVLDAGRPAGVVLYEVKKTNARVSGTSTRISIVSRQTGSCRKCG